MKIVVGAGSTHYPGWLSLQQSELDLTDSNGWARLFRPASLSAILAEHVIEHLTVEQTCQAFKLCYRYLKPGGYLRIAVPDGFHTSRAYYEWVRPGGIWNGDDHKQLLNYKSLARLLCRANFRVLLREYFDETGNLHAPGFDQSHGNIRRSHQNPYSIILGLAVSARYTSLVCDAFKV